MSDDYFSYLQSQLAALQDDPPPAGDEPPEPTAAPQPTPPVSMPSAPPAPPASPLPPAPPVAVPSFAPPAPDQRSRQARPPQPPVDPWLPPRRAEEPPPQPVDVDPWLPPRRAEEPPPQPQPVDVDPWLPPPPRAPAPPVAPQAKSRHAGRWIALVSVVGLLVSAAVVAGGVRWASTRPPSHPKQWDGRVTDIVKFVEHERGLTFKHPVAVEFMKPSDFKKKMGGGKIDAADAKELEHAVAQARALGLLHGKVNLGALEKQLAEEEVIGLYDPRTKRMYVRGDTMTPAVRVTMAHELTHALQDQYFNLKHQPDPPADFAAERALVEGDAVRVERKYITDSMSAPDKAAYEDESRRDAADANVSGLPEALTASFAFPYIYGPDFVQALVTKGGNAAVDAAMRRPPKTDAEIIDPDRYLHSVPAVFPKAPTLENGDHRLQKPSAFGEFDMLEVLGVRLGFVKAWQALDGWRGDSAVPFTRNKRDCVAVATRFDQNDHAAAFAFVANEWIQGSAPGGAVLQQGSTVQVEACDPGPNVTPPPDVTPSPVDVLQARAAAINGAASSPGADRGLATCAIDKTIVLLGAGPFMDVLRSNSLPPAARQALVTAAQDCRANGG